MGKDTQVTAETADYLSDILTVLEGIERTLDHMAAAMDRLAGKAEGK
jgi:hypothetical protein